MYFGTKSYLKSNHYHTSKHPLSLQPGRLIYIYIYIVPERRLVQQILREKYFFYTEHVNMHLQKYFLIKNILK